MAYAITDQWIIGKTKTKHLEFRQGAIFKTKIEDIQPKTAKTRSSINQIDSYTL